MTEIMTVLGPVAADSCGMVLSHEHMFIDLRNQAAPDADQRSVTADDRDKLMTDPYCLKDNLLLDSFDLAEDEGKLLLNSGCNTVVDCTSLGIGRDPRKLAQLARKTGLNIVMGCGWYTEDTHSKDFADKTAGALADELVSEIRNGADGTDIRPGVIGEIGTSREISPGEWKALEAAAIAQRKTGLAVQVHIYPWSENGLPVLRRLTDLGTSPDRIVICHSDVQPQWNYIRTLLESGVFVELDNFGKEFDPEDGGFSAGTFASDRERAELAAKIIHEGFGAQLLLTNDICLKCMLRGFGGEGYSHIFRNVIPMISEYGIPADYLKKTVMRENPLRMLTGRCCGQRTSNLISEGMRSINKNKQEKKHEKANFHINRTARSNCHYCDSRRNAAARAQLRKRKRTGHQLYQ